MKSFSCGLNIKNRDCWVVGNDEEALDKTQKLVRAGARITLVAPTLSSEFQGKCTSWGVNWLKQEFNISQLNDQFFVIFCPKDNRSLAEKIYKKCQERRILLCAVDQPEFCDVVNVSVFEKGHLRIGISTGGVSPAAAKKIRQGLEKSFGQYPVEEFFNYLAELREQLEKDVPNKTERREKLIKAVSDLEFRAKIKLPSNWNKN